MRRKVKLREGLSNYLNLLTDGMSGKFSEGNLFCDTVPQ